MLLDSVTSFQFTAVLDKEYDRYDIVPDLEKKFRRPFQIYKKYLTIIDVFETFDRFSKTKFYSDLYDQYGCPKDWGEKDLVRPFEVSELPIEITEEEKILCKEVLEFLGSKCIEAYWHQSHTTR